MTLDEPAVPPSGEGRADVAADLRLAHPAVQDVDAQLVCAVDHGLAFRSVMALQPLRAEADLADHQAGFSESSVLHRHTSCFLRPVGRHKLRAEVLHGLGDLDLLRADLLAAPAANAGGGFLVLRQAHHRHRRDKAAAGEV